MDPVVRAKQALLAINRPQLIVDGKLGPQTRSAIKSANTVEADGLAIVQRLAPAQSSTKWISHDELVILADHVAGMTGVPASYLLYIVNIETRVKTVDGQRYYDTTAVAKSGLYHGLAQVGGPAWWDATDALRRRGIHLPSAFARDGNRYTVQNPNVLYDPKWNLLAAAGFYLRNTEYARSLKFNRPLTNAVMYSAHNQGNSVFVPGFTPKQVIGKQSPVAMGVINEAFG